jgi:hypothetical protein
VAYVSLVWDRIDHRLRHWLAKFVDHMACNRAPSPKSNVDSIDAPTFGDSDFPPTVCWSVFGRYVPRFAGKDLIPPCRYGELVATGLIAPSDKLTCV